VKQPKTLTIQPGAISFHAYVVVRGCQGLHQWISVHSSKLEAEKDLNPDEFVIWVEMAEKARYVRHPKR
jgi:DNA primase